MIYLLEHLVNPHTVTSQIFSGHIMDYRTTIRMYAKFVQKYKKRHGNVLKRTSLILNEFNGYFQVL